MCHVYLVVYLELLSLISVHVYVCMYVCACVCVCVCACEYLRNWRGVLASREAMRTVPTAIEKSRTEPGSMSKEGGM